MGRIGFPLIWVLIWVLGRIELVGLMGMVGRIGVVGRIELNGMLLLVGMSMLSEMTGMLFATQRRPTAYSDPLG